LTGELPASLLSRIEDAGINASAVRQQRWLDGWLVRYADGKAKRGRCINALAPGRLAPAEKLARCRALYAAVGLPLHLRITPFSEPAGLDAELAALGLEKHDETRVMVCTRIGAMPQLAWPLGFHVESAGAASLAGILGEFRASPPAQRIAHAGRLLESPVPYEGLVMRDEAGSAVACGQVAVEAELAGLYDVHTAEAWRGRGLGRALCATLARRAMAQGARVAYLQVEAENRVARTLYASLGFIDAYGYHYRSDGAPDARG
jgi:ribosomal protein S18 acetylase RimI-like enzyme